MRLRVRSEGLEGIELGRALAAAALSHGVGAATEEALRKGRQADGHLEHPERWAREAEEAWGKAFAPALEGAFAVVAEGVPSQFVRARGRPAPDWRDDMQLRRIAEAMAAAFRSGLGLIDERERQAWAALGVLLPSGELAPSLATLSAGAWRGIRDAATLDALRQAVAVVAWTQEMRLGADWAKRHGAWAVRWFATGLQRQAEDMLFARQSALVGSLVEANYRGEGRRTLYHPGTRGPWEQEYEAVPGQALGWRGMATELRAHFKAQGEENGRDWMRVAATETRVAANAGRLMGMQAAGVERVYFQVHRDACDGCKRLYLEADGVTPKVFEIATILGHMFANNGLNVGRKARLIGEAGGWLPVGGAVHPWDRCRPAAAEGGTMWSLD